MKFTPKPLTILVQVVKPQKKESSLILPDKDTTYHIGKVIAVGQNFPFLISEDDHVMFGKYEGLCVDADNGIYALLEKSIICLVYMQNYVTGYPT